MSRHSTDFEAEQQVPAEAVEGLPSPDHRNVVPAAAPRTGDIKTRDIRGQLRRLLMAGAAVAVLSRRCLVWLGLLDRRPLSRLHRRCLCKG